MPRVTVVFGIILIALGLIGYMGDSYTEDSGVTAAASESEDAATDVVEAPAAKKSVTSLIPACFGALLTLFGLVAMNEKMRMHAMHGAVLVGLLGAIAAGGRALSKLGAFLNNDPDLNRRAFGFVAVMGILCTIYTIMCVKSFIDARKRRQLAEQAA